MNILLSIKPEYASSILSGMKKYEFRRRLFRHNIERVYIYSGKKIVGSFQIGSIIEGNPQAIWIKCKDYAGISKQDYFKYFEGSRKAYAIEIKNAKIFKEPINPYTVLRNFTPPQSFQYIQEKIENFISK